MTPTDAFPAATWMPPCPVCGKPLPWIWSGRGRKRQMLIVAVCKCPLADEQVIEAARLVNEKEGA